MNNTFELEQAIIGCILIDGSLIEDTIARNIQPLHFLVDKFKTIYANMLNMRSSQLLIDCTAYLTYINSKDVSEIYDIANKIITTAIFSTYLDLMISLKQQRDLLSTTQEIQTHLMENNSEKAFILHEQSLDIVRSNSRHIIHNIQNDLNAVMAQIHDEHISGSLPGIATGFTSLDNILSGLRQGELTIIGARPSMGKTALALNIAEHIGNKYKTIFFSLEQPRQQLIRRIFARHVKVSNIFCSHKLTDKECMDLVSLDQSSISPNLIINDDSLQSVHDIASYSKFVRKTSGLDIIFIDHLALIHTPNPKGYSITENHRLGEITKYLKAFAKTYNVAVVLLSQLRRPERNHHSRPQLTDLRDCGGIEQDADVVMFLHRDDYYKQSTDLKDNLATLIIAKNRNGICSDLTLRANLARFTFMDY